MSVVLGWISKYGVPLINMGGIIILIFVLINCNGLSSQKKIINVELNRKEKRTKFNRKTQEVEEEVTDEMTKPEMIREFEKKFNQKCSWYQVLSQMVALFPLFGIFGTVAGLMMQAKAEDIEEIKNALGTALDTTFYGLGWAIFLKFVIAISSARIIFETEAMLYDYYKKIDYTIALNNITED